MENVGIFCIAHNIFKALGKLQHHLVILWSIGTSIHRFGILYGEKSGNTDTDPDKNIRLSAVSRISHVVIRGYVHMHMHSFTY
jgi:hypothetical protein